MNKHGIDNSLNDFGKVILWQYDKAYNLIRILSGLEQSYLASVVQFWDYWQNNVLDIDNCTDFGASMWAIFIGVTRPTIVDNGGGEKHISLPLFRKFLKASFFIAASDCSLSAINKYLSFMFTVNGIQAVYVADGMDMSLVYKKNDVAFRQLDNETKMFFEQNMDIVEKYPLGIRSNDPVEEIVFGFDRQYDGIAWYSAYTNYYIGDIVKYESVKDGILKWKCTKKITARENTGWDTVKDRFVKTIEDNAITGGFCVDDHADEYREGARYHKGCIVRHIANDYVITAEIFAKDNIGWDSISGKRRSLDFSKNFTYYKGDIVRGGDGLIWVLLNHNSMSSGNMEWSTASSYFSPTFNRTTFISATTQSSLPEPAPSSSTNYISTNVKKDTAEWLVKSVGGDADDTSSYQKIQVEHNLSDDSTIADLIEISAASPMPESSGITENMKVGMALTLSGIMYSDNMKLSQFANMLGLGPDKTMAAFFGELIRK